MSENKIFLNLCRICSNEDDGVYVFSEEGLRFSLKAKITNYLHIEVSKSDKLPKKVCNTCLRKIDGHHKFATRASKVQDELREMLNSEQETNPINGIEDDFYTRNCEKEENSDDEEEEEEDYDDEKTYAEEVDSFDEEEDVCENTNRDYFEPPSSGNLLHSILTTGQSLASGDVTSGSEVTEVEVRVDPMLFLSNQYENIVDMQELTEKSHGSSNSQSSYKCADVDEEIDKTEEQKDSKPYQCTICPRGFNSEISLQNHIWNHLSRKVLSNTDLNSRLRSHGKVSELSSNGVLHTLGVLPTSQPYLCPICGRQISTKGNLKVHLETHRPKGKYACDICNRIFKTQSNLYRHKEYHGGVEFTCDVCSRVYPTKSTLRAHSITHSDLRPHQCPLCEKTFKRNQDLKFHINQHTGARPYKCPFCPKAFASSGNCFSHRKRMHPSELEKCKEMSNACTL